MDPFSWIATSAANVLTACSELYCRFKSRGLTSLLLADLLNAIEGCICQDVESLARIGLRSLNNLVIALGDADTMSITHQEADLICERLCSCLRKNLCLNFAELGVLQLTSDGAIDIRKNLSGCPLEGRRRTKGSRNKGDIGLKVESPYGVGRVMQVSKRPL